MHHLSSKMHARVLMPPCKWLDHIIHVAHQGMEHQQPHLSTWQARVVAHKPNGCTISLSSSSNEEPVLLHVVGRNILPSRAPYAAVYSFLETGGTLPPMPTPAPTPAPTAILPSLRLRAIMPHLLFSGLVLESGKNTISFRNECSIQKRFLVRFTEFLVIGGRLKRN